MQVSGKVDQCDKTVQTRYTVEVDDVTDDELPSGDTCPITSDGKGSSLGRRKNDKQILCPTRSDIAYQNNLKFDPSVTPGSLMSFPSHGVPYSIPMWVYSKETRPRAATSSPNSRYDLHQRTKALQINRKSDEPPTRAPASIFDDLDNLCRNIDSVKCEKPPRDSSKKLCHCNEKENRISVSTDLDGNSSDGVIRNSPYTIRNRRKLTKPVRSAVKYDPNFRGATMNIRTKVRGYNSKLVIACTFTSRKHSKHHCCRRNGTSPSACPSSDSDENSPCILKEPVFLENLPWRYSSLGGKVCASCATRKTPLWRDAEDGTPLCNACGIRYKKYRVRCSSCWHIPKKDGKSYPHCPWCGALLSASACRRTW